MRTPVLTPREREIATLAATRLSSREIAERLTLSVRSVDNRLQSVYHKLGIGRRGELAAILALLPAGAHHPEEPPSDA